MATTLDSLIHVLTYPITDNKHVVFSTNSLFYTNISDTGITPRLVALLHPDSPLSSARRPALEAIGHFTSGNEKQCDKVLSCDGLPALLALYLVYEQKPCPLANNNEDNNLNARKRILFTIANIVGGTSKQVRSMITASMSREITPHFIPLFLYCLTV